MYNEGCTSKGAQGTNGLFAGPCCLRYFGLFGPYSKLTNSGVSVLRATGQVVQRSKACGIGSLRLTRLVHSTSQPAIEDIEAETVDADCNFTYFTYK